MALAPELVGAVASAAGALIAIIAATIAIWQAAIARKAKEAALRQAVAAEEQAKAARDQVHIGEATLEEVRRQAALRKEEADRAAVTDDRNTAGTVLALVNAVENLRNEALRRVDGNTVDRAFRGALAAVATAKQRPPLREDLLEARKIALLDDVPGQIDEILLQSRNGDDASRIRIGTICAKIRIEAQHITDLAMKPSHSRTPGTSTDSAIVSG